jgi:uncharacterized protein (DUF2336 family)
VSPFRAVIAELEGALHSGSPGRRTDVLRRVTDLFGSKAEHLSEQQISVFDDVLSYLVAHLEKEALAELSMRLAPVTKAPPRTIRKLASHDAIEIAGPILTNSNQITDQELIEIARTKGQAHQLRIAARPQLTEAVTEVLIDRGDSEVVHEVTSNKGARFSDSGFAKLLVLADGDDRLTTTFASRSDIPPRVFRDILIRASETVRQKLLAAAPPERREPLKKILTEISGQLGTGVTVKHYAEAQKLVRSFSQDTLLTRRKLLEFAQARQLDETVATLAALTAVPIECVDRLFYGVEAHGVMVICKLMALEWGVARAVLLSRPDTQKSVRQDIEALENDYRAITPQMAQRLVRFWQSQQETPIARRRQREVVVLPS